MNTESSGNDNANQLVSAPFAPLPAPSQPTLFRDVFSPAGSLILHAELEGKSGGATKTAYLHELEVFKTAYAYFQYIKVDRIEVSFVSLMPPTKSAYAAVCLSMQPIAPAGKSMAPFFKTLSRVVLTQSSVSSSAIVNYLPVEEGLSTQVKPTPINGSIPSFSALCYSEEDDMALLKVAFHCTFRGPVYIHGSF